LTGAVAAAGVAVGGLSLPAIAQDYLAVPWTEIADPGSVPASGVSLPNALAAVQNCAIPSSPTPLVPLVAMANTGTDYIDVHVGNTGGTSVNRTLVVSSRTEMSAVASAVSD